MNINFCENKHLFRMRKKLAQMTILNDKYHKHHKIWKQFLLVNGLTLLYIFHISLAVL